MSKFVKGPVDWEYWKAAHGGTDVIVWRTRTIAIRKLIGDDVRSVLDVGAGSMFLGKLLPPEVQYYPLDYERHCDETLVCDLNAYEFPDVTADVAVLAGILEYVNDVDWLLDTLSNRVSTIVLTYRGKEKGYKECLYTCDEMIMKLRYRGFVLTGRDREFEKEWMIAKFQKAAPRLLGTNHYCTGCGACVNSCNAGAIELKPDFQGFLKPCLDTEKCVGCNRCVEVCPSIYPHENSHYANSDADCYAAWAQDEIRRESSSGGAFSVLAQSILHEGGTVFGAAWTEDFCVEHKSISSVEELAELRRSKYVQSNTMDTFRQVRDQLEKGKPVLYVGLPCQIAGLHAFLGKKYERLYAIDLICFCAVSITVFKKHLSEQFGIENVQKVVFRDKHLGWEPYGYSIYRQDGSVIQRGIDIDDYPKGYQKALYRNKTCEDCLYADFPRQGDITLGDFWGIGKHDPTWNDKKGTSIIVVNSEKGQELLDAVKADFQRIERVPLEWAKGKGNRIEKRWVSPRHKRAEDFLTNLDKYTFKERLETALQDKHDIGLICMHTNNYGNHLTNYALYQYLNDSGYSVAIINQTKGVRWNPPRELSLFGHIPYKQYDLVMDTENKLQLKKLNEKCGIFITGSDQLFRATFFEGTDLHPGMDWVTSNKPKVSYATSFGIEHFEGNATLKAKMGYFLKRFQAISVREASGIDILNQDFGINGAVCVLDPVFICDKEHYVNMARFGKMRLPQNAYLGGYILDPSEEKAALINKILEESELKEISIISDVPRGRDTSSSLKEVSIINDGPIPFLKAALVEEWLANVLYSDVFITDSFHGACFALIFEKDFWIVTNESCWRGGERLRNLVSMLEIEDRLILEGTDFSTIDFSEHIDYEEINRKLDAKREESKKWLREALELGKSFSDCYDVYDILGEQIDKTSELIDKNTVNLQRVEERMTADEKRIENGLRDSAVQLKKILEETKKHQEVERRLEQTLKEKERLLREKCALEQQIATMYQSNSWQVTWPLRKIRSVFRRLLRKIKSIFKR